MEKCIGCELCAGVCPAKCIYVRGADNDPDEPDVAGRALRLRLRDQLPALHPLRSVRRGVPDRGDHRDEAVRVLVHQPARRDLHQGPSCSSTTTASRSSSRGRTGARARTPHQRVDAGHGAVGRRRRSRASSAGPASSATACALRARHRATRAPPRRRDRESDEGERQLMELVVFVLASAMVLAGAFGVVADVATRCTPR